MQHNALIQLSKLWNKFLFTVKSAWQTVKYCVTSEVFGWENGKHLQATRELQTCAACGPCPRQGRCNGERLVLLELLLLDGRKKTSDNCWHSLVLRNFGQLFYASQYVHGQCLRRWYGLPVQLSFSRITFADLHQHVYCCYKSDKILPFERSLALQWFVNPVQHLFSLVCCVIVSTQEMYSVVKVVGWD